MKWPFQGAGQEPLSGEEERLLNQQAATIAASVLPEAVVAATRCEPAEKASSVAKKVKLPGGTETRRVSETSRKAAIFLLNHGLPDSFILAVTAGHVYVLEDTRDGGQLVAGTVLKTWDRSAVFVRVPAEQVDAQYQRQYRLPDDRRVILLWLPVAKDDQSAPAMEAAVHKFIVGRDVPSQRVIDGLRPAPKGQFVYGAAVAGDL